MATPSAATQREWARIGAAQRLHELREEEDAILSTFPELGRGKTSGGSTKAVTRSRKKKGRISPEGRKRMVAGLRKYWAAKKAAQKKAAKS